MTIQTLGATCTKEGVQFRVWAPLAKKVEVLLEHPYPSTRVSLTAEDGYFTAALSQLRSGIWYRFFIDDQGPYPDPCSRYQPQGVHGPSMIVDNNTYQWHDHDWQGVTLHGQVIYELHVGAFTPKGTLDAAAEQLEYLKSVGVTLIEIMPLNEFAGQRNWGYDGVALFAPSHNYGDYDALKRFVDRAHQLGLGVILDVVYNHLGPDGNYLPTFSPFYFTDRYQNEWGAALNLDGEHAAPVREFVLHNACEWIEQFHLDGLRLDATHSIYDSSPTHILAELSRHTRAAAGNRKIVLIAENEAQRASQLLPHDQDGFGIDGMWNDDFHHAARVALTGRRHAYFHDYTGKAQEFVSGAKYGFLYQGQYYHWQQQRRGEHVKHPALQCINFLQNHDQVANSLYGTRVNQLTSPARYRAFTALLLLAPQTPLLFMGQEFGATTPFHYFIDHNDSLRKAVHQGRRQFLAQFPGVASVESQAIVPDPAVESVFQDSKLNWEERERNRSILDLHIDLLKIRRTDRVLSKQDATQFDGAVLTDHAFLLRWFDELGDRLLLVNFGAEQQVQPIAEPLIAVNANMKWQVFWSSENIRYGGIGIEHPDTSSGWYLPAETAVLLVEQPIKDNVS